MSTIDSAARFILREAGIDSVDSALIAGSGWSGAVDYIGNELYAHNASHIDGFTFDAVNGHSPAVRIFQTRNGRRVAVMPRAHLYQGATANDVAHPVRVANALGAKSIVLTNAAGSTTIKHIPGDVVVITDHINLTGQSPANTFVDMTNCYSLHLQQLVDDLEPYIGRGVYAQFRGPQYETPAEVRMAHFLGADLVGMSTALEAIAARELGMDILGLSLVTNMAAGLGNNLAHADVLEVGKISEPRLGNLLKNVLTEI